MRKGDRTVKKLWLWKNFVDDKPEYWAFDNPYPCDENGDPITLGEPCGWGIVKESKNGRPDIPEEYAAKGIIDSTQKELRNLRNRLHVANMNAELIRKCLTSQNSPVSAALKEWAIAAENASDLNKPFGENQ